MLHGLRRRFWVEFILALITGVVALVTVFWPDWIEAVFGVDPDKGNGSVEWAVVLTLLIITVVLVIGARNEWLRVRFAER